MASGIRVTGKIDLRCYSQTVPESFLTKNATPLNFPQYHCQEKSLPKRPLKPLDEGREPKEVSQKDFAEKSLPRNVLKALWAEMAIRRNGAERFEP